MKFVIHIFVLFVLPGLSRYSHAQNNVGFGTRNPDISAIVEFKDSVRGLLIPRTDTQAVEAYVSSLSPNPGITHGLTIFETNMRTFYIYNGIKKKWEPINSIYGPQGPIGPTGPRGDRAGLTITTQWRDSSYALPGKREPKPSKVSPNLVYLGDTCGDFYHQTATGLIWNYDCDSGKWVGPLARWRNFGFPHAERIYASGLIEDTMAHDSLSNRLRLLGNLKFEIKVPPDTTAYVFITSEGTVRKSSVSYTAYNRVAFDFYIIDSGGVGTYSGNREIVTVAPNFLVVSSNFSQYDQVPWEIAGAWKLEGKISPPKKPLPVTDYSTWNFQTHFGQYYMKGNSTGNAGKIMVVDNSSGPGGRYANFAVMHVYVVYERSLNAPNPY